MGIGNLPSALVVASFSLWVACLGLGLYSGLLVVLSCFLLAGVFGASLFLGIKFDTVILLLFFPLFGVYMSRFLHVFLVLEILLVLELDSLPFVFLCVFEMSPLESGFIFWFIFEFLSLESGFTFWFIFEFLSVFGRFLLLDLYFFVSPRFLYVKA